MSQEITESAQTLVQRLINKGLRPQEISEALGGRISRRTLYRWAKGETDPQNTTDLDLLVELCKAESA